MLIETFFDYEDEIDRFDYLYYHMTNGQEKKFFFYTQLHKIIRNIGNVDHLRVLLASSMKKAMMLKLKKLNKIIHSEVVFSFLQEAKICQL